MLMFLCDMASGHTFKLAVHMDAIAIDVNHGTNTAAEL